LQWILSLRIAIINVNRNNLKRLIDCSSLPLILHQSIHPFSLGSLYHFEMLEADTLEVTACPFLRFGPLLALLALRAAVLVSALTVLGSG
jgi:hypothetical protein